MSAKKFVKKPDHQKTLDQFRKQTGIALEFGDLFLEPTGLIHKGAWHRLAFEKSKTKAAIVCQPFSPKLTHWYVGLFTAGLVILACIGLATGADFATPGGISLLVLGMVANAAGAYGLHWNSNRVANANNPLIEFNAKKGEVTIKNQQCRLDHNDVLCLMLMNSRARRGKAETLVFQLKVVTNRLVDGHHEAVVVLQNGSMPLDHYHEQLVPLAKVLSVPIVECAFDFRHFLLRRVA